MTISAINSAPTPAYDATPTRDTSGDDQARDRFAGMLANASQAHAHKPRHVEKPKDGTSELDNANASSDDKETTGASDDSSDNGASATTATAATTPVDATAVGTDGVVRSVAALNPDLQAKLARVISRVQQETGHDVTVAETLRSQTRQDTLYAQGRETAGPVVTWTQNSKHTQGRAVDLLLDGGAAGPEAYAAMQKIANEEGLRTLGAKDPGHLELPGSIGTNGTTGAANSTSLNPAVPADASGPGQVPVARLAQLASVAQVASLKVERPATVARVATVATAGSTQQGMQSKAGGVSAVPSAQLGQTQKDASDSSGNDTTDGGSQNGQGQRGGYATLGSTFTIRDHVSGSAVGAAAATTTAGSTAAERTERVMAALDSAPVRPLSQITMNVDAGNGASDRIQVALRGSALNTTIDVSDARAAQTMTARSDELVRALTRDGMEVESMRVRAVAGPAAPIVTQSTQSSSDSQTSSRFERGNPWQQQERQDSQNDRRQQQREQRGGEEE